MRDRRRNLCAFWRFADGFLRRLVMLHKGVRYIQCLLRRNIRSIYMECKCSNDQINEPMVNVQMCKCFHCCANLKVKRSLVTIYTPVMPWVEIAALPSPSKLYWETNMPCTL